MRDPVVEVASNAMPRALCPGAPEPRWLGPCLLTIGPWLASQIGQEPRPELGHVDDREPEARASPRALCGGCAMLRLG
jgi:hypothetical protein